MQHLTTLKHFTLVFFHTFTFILLMHLVKLIGTMPMTYHDIEVQFTSIIAVSNLGLVFYHLSRLLHSVTNHLDVPLIPKE